ncbi:MAG: methyl-accepting chemotaxis protein, partial [bacterium]
LSEMTRSIRTMIEQIESLKRNDRDEKERLEARVREISAAVELVAMGDLTGALSPESEDAIIGGLKENLNMMSGSLRNMIGKVSESAALVEKSSRTISAIMDRLESGAKTQRSSIEDASRSVGGLLESLGEVVERSEKVTAISLRAADQARTGGGTVSDALDSMEKINEAMGGIQEVMQELEAGAEGIGEIVQVIDEISDQTNLLALNASIEAARAGDYGRGFSVVAREVSGLAQRSVESTREITSIVRTIQDRVRNAIQTTDAGMRVVRESHKLARESGEALNQIIASVEEVTTLIRETVTALEAHRDRSGAITDAMAKVSEISRESSRIVRDAAAAVQALMRLAGDLDLIVQQFKIQAGEKTGNGRRGPRGG